MTFRCIVGSCPKSAMPAFRNGRLGIQPVPPGKAIQTSKLPELLTHQQKGDEVGGHAPRYCVALQGSRNPQSDQSLYSRRRAIGHGKKLFGSKHPRRVAGYEDRRFPENRGFLSRLTISRRAPWDR